MIAKYQLAISCLFKRVFIGSGSESELRNTPTISDETSQFTLWFGVCAAGFCELNILFSSQQCVKRWLGDNQIAVLDPRFNKKETIQFSEPFEENNDINLLTVSVL